MDVAAGREHRPPLAGRDRAGEGVGRFGKRARVGPVLSWSVVAVFAVTFLLYRNAVLNHFYEFGAGTDAFWFSGMMWRTDLALMDPPGMDDRSFYHVHFSVLFVIPALISHFLAYDHIEWFALVTGFLHGVATGGLAWILWEAARRRVRQAWAANLIALTLGFAYATCGLQAAFMGLPHIEIAIPGMLIATFGALALRRPTAAWIFFIALLGSREDGGFHAATFLVPLVAYVRWRERRWLKLETILTVVGLIYPLLAMAAVPQFVPESGIFRDHYIGNPPFAHVTWDKALDRLNYVFWQSGRVWVPLFILAIYALWRRDAVVAIGAIAVAPWLALHIIFFVYPTGFTLSYYYPFPVLVSLAWPGIVALYRAGPAAVSGMNRPLLLLALQLGVIAAANVPPLNSRLAYYFSLYEGMAFTLRGASFNMDAYRAFNRALEHGRPELGRVGANVPAVALAPHVLRRPEWNDLLGEGAAANAERLDTIVLFEGYWPCPEINAAAAKARLPNAFEVPGTRIIILTRRNLGELLSFWSMLVPHPKPEGPFCGRKKLR